MPSDGWNNINVKYRDDRIFLDVNGRTVAVNHVISNIPGSDKAAPAKGDISIASTDGSDTNPYTLDHNNHPGLFNKEAYISFCGHDPGLKFRNFRVF